MLYMLKMPANFKSKFSDTIILISIDKTVIKIKKQIYLLCQSQSL